MLKPEETRRLEVKQGDAWILCPDQGMLEPGDIFRMFEPDGTPVSEGLEYRVGKHPAIYCDQVRPEGIPEVAVGKCRVCGKSSLVNADQRCLSCYEAVPGAVSPYRQELEEALKRAQESTGAAAVICGGKIEVSIDIDALPAIVSGSCCADGLDGFWKVTDAAVFAKEVCRALNAEDEIGTTRVHRMFDGAFKEAIEQGAEGIEECSEEEFERIAATFMAAPLEDPGRPVPPHGSGP